MSWLDDASASGHTLTAFGDAASSPSPAQGSAAGSLSLATLAGNGGLSTPASSDFNFGSAPFTVEAWWYPTFNEGTLPNHVASIISQMNGYSGSDTDASWALYYDCWHGTIVFSYTTDGHTLVTNSSSWTPVQDTWYHLCVERDSSNNLVVFVNGAEIVFATIGSDVFHSSSNALWIGNDVGRTTESGAVIDGVRITKGVGRYTWNLGFTPPNCPMPTGSGDTYWSDVVLDLPFAAVNTIIALTGVSATGQVGIMTLPPAVVGLTLPTPRLAVTGTTGSTAAITLGLPTPTLTASGMSPVAGAVALTLPRPALAVTALAGISGAVSLALPAPVLSIGSPNSVALALPTPQLAITGSAGVVGSVSLALPTPQIAIGATAPVAGSVVLALPTPQLAVQALPGIVGVSNNTLTRFALAISGASGVVGTVTLALPVIQLGVEGYTPVNGAVALTLPLLKLVANGTSLNTGTPATTVMHTETMSLWTYSNYPFNSFAQFNGAFLGADANGIFALAGDTDNGAMIQAAARVGLSDFGTSFLKRVDRIYVGYSADGAMVMRVLTDTGTQRDYRMAATPEGGLHGNHVRLGKGLESRYWQFEVRNQNGADFTMNIIELKPTRLKRRVGGADA